MMARLRQAPRPRRRPLGAAGDGAQGVKHAAGSHCRRLPGEPGLRRCVWAWEARPPGGPAAIAHASPRIVVGEKESSIRAGKRGCVGLQISESARRVRWLFSFRRLFGGPPLPLIRFGSYTGRTCTALAYASGRRWAKKKQSRNRCSKHTGPRYMGCIPHLDIPCHVSSYAHLHNGRREALALFAPACARPVPAFPGGADTAALAKKERTARGDGRHRHAHGRRARPLALPPRPRVCSSLCFSPGGCVFWKQNDLHEIACLCSMAPVSMVATFSPIRHPYVRGEEVEVSPVPRASACN